ncbi:MAG: ribosome recycling factor [Ruminococcaceae bacterium]|nr:ribosome recycling factor [Oscillospiraceae bacterium]
MDKTIKKAEESMQKRVDYLESEYARVRAGRANPGVLDKVMVDYYGTPTPVQQLAAINVAEARTLTIQPWDASALKGIEKAILTSDIGINPQNDGKCIRLVFPPLTEDRRKEIVKEIAKNAEDTKVQVRNERRDAIEALKKLKKNSEITEDDLEDGQEKIQKITDKFIKKIDELCQKKQKEIMEI